MTERPFHVVDVFATRKYAGNQLAVVEAAGDLSAAEMERIAREFDYSETTFVESTDLRDGGYDVRIFTPEEEIPFAGHPTLGTAWVLREFVAEDPGDEVVLNLPVGQIPVTADLEDDDELLWMRQQSPTFGERFDHATLADVLSLSRGDLDEELPVRRVSTGLPTTVVPLRNRDALERIAVDRAAYDEFVAGHDARNVLAFCPAPRGDDADYAARVFAPYYGVPEDPATGSSNGCLAGYLVRHARDDGPVSATVEQGYEMGRPSRLHLDAREDGDEVAVRVGGRVVHVASGTLV